MHAWAATRQSKSAEPALLIFVPVKCESYIKDSIHSDVIDKSKDLYDKICSLYKQVIETAFGQAPHVRMVYIPIDTIGCIKLKKGKWEPNLGDYHFSADYLLTGKNLVQYGAEDIMKYLIRCLMESKKILLELDKSEKEKYASDKYHRAEKSEGFFGDIWIWITGERKERKQASTKAEKEKDVAIRMLDTFQAVLEKISDSKSSPRVKEIHKNA